MLMNSNLQRKGGRGGEEEMKEIEKTRKEGRLNRKTGRKFSSRRHVFYLEAREASHQGNESRLEGFFQWTAGKRDVSTHQISYRC